LGVLKLKKKVHYRRKKKKSKIKSFLIKFILITILLTVSLVLFARTSYFNISSVKVIGNTRYKEAEIIKTSNIKKGANGFVTMGISPIDIFTLSFGKSENAILNKYPYVKNVNVRFNIPKDVSIIITEREPSSIIDYKGQGIIVDKELYALDILKQGDRFDVPKLYGIEFDTYKFGQVLKIKNTESISILTTLTDSINKNDEGDNLKLYRLIKSIDLKDINNISITIKPDIKVNFGDLSDLEYRITYFKQIYPVYIKSSSSGYMDFTTGENPVFQPG
jgi:cell division protein FtsQ